VGELKQADDSPIREIDSPDHQLTDSPAAGATLLVGRVARAHGNKGAVIVNPETDFAGARFAIGNTLVVEQAGQANERRIEAVRFHDGRPIVALEGISTMDAAGALAGAALKMREADLAPLTPGTFYRHDLVGCDVKDAAGLSIGRVMRVEGPIARSLLVVASRRGEVMIPMVEGIIVKLDVADKRIVVELPEGLVDLNENAPRIGESDGQRPSAENED
jgi:16S rRNA processing protein RimM